MKKWYRSKTIWANLIAVGALILQEQTGHVVLNEELQLLLLALLNTTLRFITTKGLE